MSGLSPVVPGFFNPIQGDYALLRTAPQRLLPALDAMAAVETEHLAYLGKRFTSYGRHIAQIAERGAVLLHFPEGRFDFATLREGGGPSGAHPGGQRQHTFRVTTMVLVGPVGLDPFGLVEEAAEWIEPLDRLYCKNSKVGGIAQRYSLDGGEWGAYPWGQGGKILWFGIKLFGELHLRNWFETG